MRQPMIVTLRVEQNNVGTVIDVVTETMKAELVSVVQDGSEKPKRSVEHRKWSDLQQKYQPAGQVVLAALKNGQKTRKELYAAYTAAKFNPNGLNPTLSRLRKDGAIEYATNDGQVHKITHKGLAALPA